MPAYPTDLAQDALFTDIAAALDATVEAAGPRLRAVSEADASRPLARGKWSAKQTLGHLIDSAANNHQRFVRVREVESLTLPGYEQDLWVGVQRYDARPWTDLVDFWTGYNRHLVHLLRQTPDGEARKACTIGDHAPISLHELVRDYVGHVEHHLRQIGASRQA